MSDRLLPRVTHIALPWILPVAIVGSWDLAVRIGWIPPSILPLPEDVLGAAAGLIATGALKENLIASTGRAATGFFIGSCAGFLLALLCGLFPIWRNALNPSLQTLRSVPSLGILPILILIFGFGETTKLTIIALGTFVPIYLNTFAGIQLADPRHLELARAQRLTRWQSLRDIVLPSALPSIFTGLRFSLGVAWITLIVAESFSTDPGIGYMARHARERNLSEIVVLSVVIYALLGKLTDLAVRTIEAKSLNWHVNFAARAA